MIRDIDGLLEHSRINLNKRMDIAVIGLSGGADSLLVSLLCMEALGKENVHVVHMPYSKTDFNKFNSNSTQIAAHLFFQSHMVPITNPTSLFARSVVEGLGFENLSELNFGNMKSRMRMVVLYSVCCHLAEKNEGKKVRVVGTGNLSEDFIGFDTKGGDSLADYFPIGSLVKSEVYQLLDYFRDRGVITEKMIDRVPSAGLWEGQTDEDELGYTYEQMEPYVIKMNKEERSWRAQDFIELMRDPIAEFVWKRHVNNAHKHMAPPVLALRGFCDDGVEE